MHKVTLTLAIATALGSIPADAEKWHPPGPREQACISSTPPGTDDLAGYRWMDAHKEPIGNCWRERLLDQKAQPKGMGPLERACDATRPHGRNIPAEAIDDWEQTHRRPFSVGCSPGRETDRRANR